MHRGILLLTESDAGLVSAGQDEWEKHNLVICKTTSLEETISELKSGYYLLIIVSINKDNSRQIQKQIKILRSLTAAPIAVIAEEPVDITLKIDALYDGADQVFHQPLTPKEAAASSLALIRRFTELNKVIDPVTIYYDHGVLLCADHRKVFIGGTEVELLKKEFDILCMLIRNHARVLTYEQIFGEVWGDEYTDNSKDLLWTQIRRLRNKIQIDPGLPNYIKTVRELGYSFDPQYAKP